MFQIFITLYEKDRCDLVLLKNGEPKRLEHLFNIHKLVWKACPSLYPKCEWQDLYLFIRIFIYLYFVSTFGFSQSTFIEKNGMFSPNSNKYLSKQNIFLYCIFLVLKSYVTITLYAYNISSGFAMISGDACFCERMIYSSVPQPPGRG